MYTFHDWTVECIHSMDLAVESIHSTVQSIEYGSDIQMTQIETRMYYTAHNLSTSPILSISNRLVAVYCSTDFFQSSLLAFFTRSNCCLYFSADMDELFLFLSASDESQFSRNCCSLCPWWRMFLFVMWWNYECSFVGQQLHQYLLKSHGNPSLLTLRRLACIYTSYSCAKKIMSCVQTSKVCFCLHSTLWTMDCIHSTFYPLNVHIQCNIYNRNGKI